jgi:hypothetical protein
MRYVADTEKLLEWAKKSTFVKTTWFAPRKECWDRFEAFVSVDTSTKELAPGKSSITQSRFNTIKSVCLARASELQSQQVLAFETAVQGILEELGDRDEDDDDPKAEQK